MNTVTIIKAYSLNGIIKPIGTQLPVTENKMQELAEGGYIEIDERFKTPKPKRSKVKIENTSLNK